MKLKELRCNNITKSDFVCNNRLFDISENSCTFVAIKCNKCKQMTYFNTLKTEQPDCRQKNDGEYLAKNRK